MAVLLAGLLALPLAGGDPLRFLRITPENGLSQGTILALAQDPAGYVWIGTQDGLNRFDGQTLKVFTHDPRDPTSLSGNYVSSLAVDASGFLWVGTLGTGLNRFDPRSGAALRYRKSLPGGVSGDQVRSLFTDRRGAVWVVTDQGLDVFLPGHSSPRTVAEDPATRSQPGFSIAALFEDPRGNLWAATTRRGLRAIDQQRLQLGPAEPYPADLAAPGGAVLTALCTSGGDTWVGTAGLGPRRIRSRTAADTAAPWPAALRHASIRVLAEAPDGQVWAGTTHGLWLLPRALDQTPVFHPPDPMQPDGLSHGTVASLFADRTGSMWVGTFNGLNLHSRFREKFRLCRAASRDPERERRGFILALAEDDGGRIWAGTMGGGLVRCDLGAGLLRPWPSGGPWNREEPAADRAEPTLGTIWALGVDRHGRLWAADRQDLLRIDPATRRTRPSAGLRRYFRDHPGAAGAILTLTRAPDGRFWLGIEGRPPVCFDPLLDQAGPAGPGEMAGRPLPEVRAFHFDQDGGVWMGSTTHGLLHCPPGGPIRNFRNDPAVPGSLSSDRVFCVLRDRRGTLWVGTKLGLNRMVDESTGRFQTITRHEGLPNDTVLNLLEDPQGRLWLATNRGLACYSPADRGVRRYDTADGLQGREFNRAALRTAAGRLLFAGTEGLSHFDPSALEDNPHPPPIVITGLVDSGGRELPLPTDGRDVELPYWDASCTFRFAGLDFSMPGRVQYAVQLEGSDPRWVKVGERSVTFSRLRPGRYVFRVKASNGDGVWNHARPTALNLLVRPPYWETGWFRAVAALAAAGALGAVYRLRIRALQHHRTELETQVAARTRELAAANQELEAMARQDPLTGLSNRRVFTEKLGQEWNRSRRSGRPLSLVMIDLDRFKAINDTHGHPAGDACLRAAAEVLQEISQRSSDLAARYGGEEFVLLQAEAGMEQAAATAERVRKLTADLRVPHPESGQALQFTVSIGVASVVPGTEPTLAPKDLIQRADQALYAAKAGGRDRVVGWPPPG